MDFANKTYYGHVQQLVAQLNVSVVPFPVSKSTVRRDSTYHSVITVESSRALLVRPCGASSSWSDGKIYLVHRLYGQDRVCLDTQVICSFEPLFLAQYMEKSGVDCDFSSIAPIWLSVLHELMMSTLRAFASRPDEQDFEELLVYFDDGGVSLAERLELPYRHQQVVPALHFAQYIAEGWGDGRPTGLADAGAARKWLLNRLPLV
ncbi:hypothetical protein ACP3V3_01820 [Vibrio sp. PNB22_3_1]